MPQLLQRPGELAALNDLLAASPVVRLLTVNPDGVPAAGMVHFTGDASLVEFHLRRDHPQLPHLAARPMALEADEYFTAVPSHWVDRFDGAALAPYYRLAVLHGESERVEAAETLAEHFTRFMAKYQPEGAYEPFSAGGGALQGFVLVRFKVNRVDFSWRLGQHHPPELRRKLIDKLRTRGRLGDQRAADEILQWLMTHPEGDLDPLKYE